MPHPKVKISDDSGNTVAVDTSGSSNALNVKLADSDDIDIGNVVLTAHSSGSPVLTTTATSAVLDLDGQILLGTHSLLSARKDDSTTIGLTCEDSTHNALHVAISDGTAIAGVSSNRLNVNATLKAGVNELEDNTGDIGDGVLRVTVANDDNVSTKLSSIDTDTSSMATDLGYLGATAGTHDAPAATRGAQLNGQSRVVDGSIFPSVDAEGDSARLNCSGSGILFTHLTTENGSYSAVVKDDTGQQATPGMVNVGGEYRASPTSYTDGDATVLQTNVNGALNIAGTVDLGTTDNAVLDAMVVDLAAMEALLITIDSDTDAIKTAVQILDDWDDSNYANVNLNIAGTDVSANAGTMDAQTLRVTLATDDTHWGAVGAAADVDGVAHGQLRHIGNSLSGLATQSTLNTISTNVNYLLQTEDSAHSSGAVGTTSFAVRNDTLASLVSDDGDYACLQVNATGALYVDVADGGQLDTIIDTLETTLTAIETDQAAIEVLLTGIDADTNAIKTAVEILDDWDDSNYANVNINLAGSDAPTGGGAESGALRVTLANDSTGVISIDDGGNTITVDGTVTANLGTTDNGVLDAIAASLALLDNSISSGSELQVDVVAALPAGTNAIGKLAENSGVDIGDVTVTNIGNWLNVDSGGTGAVVHAPTNTYNVLDAVMSVGVVCKDVLAAQSGVTNLEYTNLLVDTQGALYTTHGMTGMVSGGNFDIDTSAEQLDGGTDGYDVPCKRVDLKASPTNTADIWLGDSGVLANGLGGGIRLSPGDFYSIDIDNLTDIWVIAISANQSIHFNYFT